MKIFEALNEEHRKMLMKLNSKLSGGVPTRQEIVDIIVEIRNIEKIKNSMFGYELRKLRAKNRVNLWDEEIENIRESFLNGIEAL